MRFNQPAYPTVFFSTEILVHCPKCSERGVVRTDLGKYTIPFPNLHESKFTCKSCSHIIKDCDSWEGYNQGYVHQACGHCGSFVTFSSKPTMTPFEKTEIQCETCDKSKEYAVTWMRYREDKPRDPYFGLELWLKTEIKENVLWLFNLKHLEYLRDYVGSKLREDDGRHKYSMITNLPQWVKSAKNRDLILKKLSRLEKENCTQHPI